ncbi:conserved hypothetical protein [Culex quinquefasciatus]|uniref:Ig-like domain-containing protein n=1 Tax=Culex quinquefasciatus TaxID=7176 RepID=B0XCX6_CULQU|nr:conserved hypothetical protein [Culex quinquefasciatus]|eukprot:XP_001867498.1 conserved hypothetical protein [Culex quinquefasciatus]
MYHHLPSQWPTPADVTPKPTAPRPPPEPYFVPTASKNATIRQGDPAFLSCQVENLGAYTVSWIRVRDLHILTVDRYTYTADQRFQSLHNNETGEWTLNIKWTERKDTGIYECQVSTLPVKSLALYLIVLDYLYLAATTQILEGTMVYGYKGEDLNLTCMVNHNYDRRPNHVIWYHQNDIVAYEQLRKRDRSPLNSITSYHLIRNVDFDDAGNYTCAPDIYTSASTIVHILDGDEMQSAKSNAASAFGTLPVTTVTALAWTTVFGLLCILYCHPDNAR